jgi:hypothetical protein
MASVVSGEENEADTYRAFYYHTGLKLKQLGVALLRLDHAGKDPDRGQRGSSAKAEDVDVVFQLSVIKREEVLLKRTHTRVPWVPPEVLLSRESEPVFTHRVKADGVPADIQAVIDDLDQLSVPGNASANNAEKALRDNGRGRQRALVLEAVKMRRARS